MTNFLVFLLFIAPTVQYRVELGSVSFSLMEPITLVCAGVLIIRQTFERKRLSIAKDPTILLFAGISAWAFIIRPWSANWQHGLSDIRDWVVPLLGYTALVSTIRLKWQAWIRVFLAWVIFLAIFGIFQHFMPSARPFLSELALAKTGFAVSKEDEFRLQFVAASTGFFTHPNGFAMYLFLGLMTALGWLNTHPRRWYKLLLVILISLALYWAYAKASLVVMAFAVIAFWLQHWIRPKWLALLAIGLVGIFAMLFVWALTPYIPDAIFNTLRWRVGLWEIAIQTITSHPKILLIGNGMDLFSEQAFYGQPHNLYFYLLLEYGMPGLLFIASVMGYLLARGRRLIQRGALRQSPILAGLWLGLLGFCLIGLVESNLMGIENRMIFLITLACFTGLARVAPRPAQSEAPVHLGGIALLTHGSN